MTKPPLTFLLGLTEDAVGHTPQLAEQIKYIEHTTGHDIEFFFQTPNSAVTSHVYTYAEVADALDERLCRVFQHCLPVSKNYDILQLKMAAQTLAKTWPLQIVFEMAEHPQLKHRQLILVDRIKELSFNDDDVQRCQDKAVTAVVHGVCVEDVGGGAWIPMMLGSHDVAADIPFSWWEKNFPGSIERAKQAAALQLGGTAGVDYVLHGYAAQFQLQDHSPNMLH